MLVVEDCANSNAVTVLVRGGNSMIVEEAKVTHQLHFKKIDDLLIT